MTHQSLSPEMTSMISSPSGKTTSVVTQARLERNQAAIGRGDLANAVVCASAKAGDAVSPTPNPTNEPNTKSRTHISTLRRITLRRETIESHLEAKLPEHGADAFVVDGRVRIDPIALWIDREREHFRQVRALQQNLLSGNEARQQVQLPSRSSERGRRLADDRARVGEQQASSGSFRRRSAAGRRMQSVVDCLRRQNHGSVSLSPVLSASCTYAEASGAG